METLKQNKGTLLTGAFFIFALGVGKSFDLLSISQFLIGLAMFSILALLIALLVKVEVDTVNFRHINSVILKLNEIVQNSKPDKYNFFLSEIELFEKEKGLNCSEIWIISNDLENDHEKSFFFPAIKSNIEKGVKYKYLVPDTIAIDGKITSLKKVFRSHPNQIEIFKTESEKIKNITYTDVAFYNPTGEPNSEPEDVFFRLPIKEFNYWVKYREDLEWEVKGKIDKAFRGSRKI